MAMDMILDEVRRDVFEHPKSTIDLDYLFSVKREIQRFADDTNSQLKKNVYQNYSLFIDSSREIATLKEEMKQLNILLDEQRTSMSKLLDQLDKTPFIQPTLERPEPRNDIHYTLNNIENADEDRTEMLPDWFVKSPEDLDVHIAQRSLEDAVELAKRVEEHFVQYPKCCENRRADLKEKIINKRKELIKELSSELQPATGRSVQGGPRSSIKPIQLLCRLNLSSKAVKLYLDLRSSILRFVLDQQKIEAPSSFEHVKLICSQFFHHTKETCDEFKQAFGLDECIESAIRECDYLDNQLGSRLLARQNKNQPLLFDRVSPIYQSEHPKLENNLISSNGNDISSQILSPHAVKVTEDSLMPARTGSGYRTFNQLSTYASLTYWLILEFEFFASIFSEHVIKNRRHLSLSTIAESIYHQRDQCSKMTASYNIDMSQFIDDRLREEIQQVIRESGNKLLETTRRLIIEEKWQPQQFHNKVEKMRFLDEMNGVDLKTMPKYISDDFKLHFTASKTAFARCFLITVNDLAQLVNPSHKEKVDTILADAFELQMESVIDALKKAKQTSKARIIKANSNFLLDKVILVANDKYASKTNMTCQKLANLRAEYQKQADSLAKLQNV